MAAVARSADIIDVSAASDSTGWFQRRRKIVNYLKDIHPNDGAPFYLAALDRLGPEP
jgi:hypothetical protein